MQFKSTLTQQEIQSQLRPRFGDRLILNQGAFASRVTSVLVEKDLGDGWFSGLIDKKTNNWERAEEIVFNQKDFSTYCKLTHQLTTIPWSFIIEPDLDHDYFEFVKPMVFAIKLKEHVIYALLTEEELLLGTLDSRLEYLTEVPELWNLALLSVNHQYDEEFDYLEYFTHGSELVDIDIAPQHLPRGIVIYINGMLLSLKLEGERIRVAVFKEYKTPIEINCVLLTTNRLDYWTRRYHEFVLRG